MKGPKTKSTIDFSQSTIRVTISSMDSLNTDKQAESAMHRSNSALSFTDDCRKTPLSPVTPTRIAHTPTRNLALTPSVQINKIDSYENDNESALEITSLNSSIQSLQSLKSPNLSNRPVSKQTLQSLKSPNFSTRPTTKQTLHLSVQSLQTIGHVDCSHYCFLSF